ncbi:MAG: NUDIX domain-containing protein [Candidatus Microsaccharimonas sp.]
MQQGQYPNAFYRVSVKAVIVNEKNEIFTVHEGEDWTLPGGGLDHGEKPLTALKRELYEEAFITSDFKAVLIGTESFYVDSKDAMAFWLIYRLDMTEPNFTYKAGEDADEVTFRNPSDFKDSDSLFERLIYKYGSRITL